MKINSFVEIYLPACKLGSYIIINLYWFEKEEGIPATRPSSDMCMNEIIFLPVLRDFTSFNMRFYFLLLSMVVRTVVLQLPLMPRYFCF